MPTQPVEYPYQKPHMYLLFCYVATFKSGRAHTIQAFPQNKDTCTLTSCHKIASLPHYFTHPYLLLHQIEDVSTRFFKCAIFRFTKVAEARVEKRDETKMLCLQGNCTNKRVRPSMLTMPHVSTRGNGGMPFSYIQT